MQEVRNAVDQASREVATRFDFKNTGASVELKGNEILLNAPTEDRRRALVQVLEEKLVRRQVSLKAVSYGKIEEASKGALRQTRHPERRHLLGPRQEDQQDHQGPRPQGCPVPDPRRPGPRHRQEARRPAGGDRRLEGAGPRHPPPVRQLPRLRALSRSSPSARTGRARLRTRTSRGWRDRPRPPVAARNRTFASPIVSARLKSRRRQAVAVARA